jgi:hypothetical protein
MVCVLSIECVLSTSLPDEILQRDRLSLPRSDSEVCFNTSCSILWAIDTIFKFVFIL